MTSVLPKVAASKPEKSNINETDLCNKIKNLMTNMKAFYPSNLSLVQSNDSPLESPMRTSTKYSSTAESEYLWNNTKSEDNTSLSSISLVDDDYYKDDDDFNKMPALLNQQNNKLKGVNSNRTEISHPNSNLIPQRTFMKIIALESLIMTIHNNLTKPNVTANANNNKNVDKSTSSVNSCFYNLRKQFEELKMKVKLGTQTPLPESEVFDIMKRLKMLFDKLCFFKDDNKVDDNNNLGEKSVKSNPTFVNVTKPLVAPRNKKFKPGIVTTKASSTDDITKPFKRDLTDIDTQNNKLTIEPIKRNSGGDIFDPKTIHYKQRNFAHLSNPNIDKLKQNLINISNHNCLSNPFRYDNFHRLRIRHSNSTSDLSCHRSNVAVSNLFLQPKFSNCLNKSISFNNLNLASSKLPILKKGTTNFAQYENFNKISILSKTVTKQVIGNLKRMGILDNKNVKKHLNTKLNNSKRCKSDLTLNKQLNDKLKVVEKENQFVKSCDSYLYLTKLNGYKFKKQRGDLLSLMRDSKIYCLGNLLKKNKYKFVKESNNCFTGFVKNDDSNICNEQEKNEKVKENKIEIEVEKIKAIIGRSLRVVYQLVVVPNKFLEKIDSENDDQLSLLRQQHNCRHYPTVEQCTKNPRLTHIENTCSCKITVISAEDIAKRKLKSDKNTVLLEIHYDLRKGKALGCINMLRKLTESGVNRNVKIYRSSVLLPGGYLKEMTTCSFNELVNMSTQVGGRITKQLSTVNCKQQQQQHLAVTAKSKNKKTTDSNAKCKS